MRGGECLADVQVGQRGQAAHHPRLSLLLERELDVIQERGDFLGQETDVVEQYDFARFQTAHRLARRWAAHVVHETDFHAHPVAERLGVLFQADYVLVVQCVALVGHQRHRSAAFVQLFDGRQALDDAVVIDDAFGLRVQRRVDVDPADHFLVFVIEIVQRQDTDVSHGDSLLN